jgi:uncharacterized protein
MPTGIGVVDTMIGFPREDAERNYDFLKPLLRKDESANHEFPAQYMFKQRTNVLAEGEDPIEATLGNMDRHGIAKGLIGTDRDVNIRALKEHPDRFAGVVDVDPNDIMGALRKIRQTFDELPVKGVNCFPAGCNPQVPVSDRRLYPVYAACIDLDLPMLINAGVPGPRVPMACQHIDHFDQVCYDFPELRIVMRHGAEPWEEMAVKLMLKWPGLYYSTSAFAPKHYPRAIIDYANTRGADKIIYAGYYPMGLTLDRIFDELQNVPFKDEVWPKFLRDNAMRVFNL